MRFKAVEKPAEVRAAMGIWKGKFAQVTEEQGNTLWHEDLKVAAKFSAEDDGSKWWTAFSDTPTSFRQNLVVELNPPVGAENKRIMGLIATAPNGDRWILHQGRLRIGKSMSLLPQNDFDDIANLPRSTVRFVSGNVAEYIAVANIDAPADEMAQQIAKYVHACRRVKTHYEDGPEMAALDDAVDLIEGDETTENRGKKHLKAQPPKTVDKAHPEVWVALTKAVDKLGVPRRARRISGLGYDLLTCGDHPALFEIKTSVSAANIQQGLGQLLIYENLVDKLLKLKKPVQKVLLVPDEKEISAVLVPILKAYGIETMTYGLKGKMAVIDTVALAKLIAPKSKLKAV